MNSISDGYDTCRVTAAHADLEARRQRDAAALAYLVANDAADIAVILGLIPQSRRPRRTNVSKLGATLPPRVCEHCRRRYTPSAPEQRACGKSCGSKLGAATKRKAART